MDGPRLHQLSLAPNLEIFEDYSMEDGFLQFRKDGGYAAHDNECTINERSLFSDEECV
jgi:hypothetical protein